MEPNKESDEDWRASPVYLALRQFMETEEAGTRAEYGPMVTRLSAGSERKKARKKTVAGLASLLALGGVGAGLILGSGIIDRLQDGFRPDYREEEVAAIVEATMRAYENTSPATPTQVPDEGGWAGSSYCSYNPCDFELTAEEKAAIREWLLRFRTGIMDQFEGYLVGNKPVVPVPLQPLDEIFCYSRDHMQHLADCNDDNRFPVDLSGHILGFGNLSWGYNDPDITYHPAPNGGQEYVTVGPKRPHRGMRIDTYWNLQSHTFEPDDLVWIMTDIAWQLRDEHEALGSPAEVCPSGYSTSEETWDNALGGLYGNITGQTFDEYADSLGMGCSGGSGNEDARFYRSMALRYWELANEYYSRLWELTE